MSNFISGTLNIKNNIIGVNCVPESNNDMGIIMQLNTQNITDYEYQNTLVGATSNTATINETVNIGWVIESSSVGDKKRIINVSGFVITIDSPWSSIPLAGTTYKLYKKTHVAIIYKPLLKQLQMGYTYNNSSDTSVDVFSPFSSSPVYMALVNNIIINISVFVTCFNLAWNSSLMSAGSLNMALYIETSNTVDIQVIDGSLTYGTGTYGLTGHYIMPLMVPASTTLLQLQVKGGRGTLVSAVLVLS